MHENCHRCRGNRSKGLVLATPVSINVSKLSQVSQESYSGVTERPLKGQATEALGEGGPKGRLMSGKDCRKGLVIAPPS